MATPPPSNVEPQYHTRSSSTSSSLPEWSSQPQSLGVVPRSRRQRRSGHEGLSATRTRRPHTVTAGAASGSDSDSSSDAEGVFAFQPPTPAEQVSVERQLTTSSQYPVSQHPPPHSSMTASSQYPVFQHPPLHSNDALTLVGSPPMVLPGPGYSDSDVNNQAQYSYPISLNPAIPSLDDSDTYSVLRHNYSRDKTDGERRRVFQLFRKAIEPIPDNKSVTSQQESTIAFDFEDTGDEPKLTSSDLADDSPYPEVRASVSNIDDPSMPVLTIRMWFIGLSLCCISAALNTFFNFRFPAPRIVPLALVLIAHPLGKLAAYVLPIKKYHLPSWLGSYEFSLNPGPWNIKEHVCVFLMANVAIRPGYVMDAIVVMEKFYIVELGVGFDITLILATHLIGFGIAGFVRRFLVWPASMIWPQNLVVCTLLNTLHAEEESTFPPKSGITRYKFFMLTAGAAFAFFFLPGYLFKALSIFSYVCWIAPNNVVINQLFGVRSGLGLGILTFDWSQISYIGSPLMVPWWAQVHVMSGFILFYWIIAPILYYSNAWNLAHFPMISIRAFDNTGHPYLIHRIMAGEHATFNETAYNDYSPLYFPVSYAICYFLAIALSTCVLTHTILHHGRSIVDNILHVSVEEDDVHARLMRHYPEVPNWWYLACIAVFFSVAISSIRIWSTGMPIWALCLSLMLPMLYILPAGFLYAFTGQTFSLNLIGEIVPGVLFPGKPLVNVIFKACSSQSLEGALDFVQGLKLGHYIKTPPLASFLVQLVATVLACLIQVGVKRWLFANVAHLCTHDQADFLICPQSQVAFTASAVWGLIGPARQFGRNALYMPELYALILGALLPFPFWLHRRRYPDSKFPSVSVPVFLNGPCYIPPATGLNYSSWFAVGFVFQYLIRTRNFMWWSKFNYILSAALDSGTVLSTCAIFFFLQFIAGGVSLNWIGNTIFMRTADWEARPLIPASSTPF